MPHGNVDYKPAAVSGATRQAASVIVLRDAPRGGVRIEVTFILDASGTLDVRAVDVETGIQQATRINLLGGVSEDEIRSMQARQSLALGGPR